MRALLFFPLAFVADVHGFMLVAPYLVIFLTVVRTAQVRRLNAAVPVRVGSTRNVIAE